MSASTEFHYRLPGRADGCRPGSHLGTRLGAGQEFVTHASLYEWPDPRRLDLRASLRSARDDWLVRVHRQRAQIAVHALVDVSASMHFGGKRTKLQVVADFVESLGDSAFRVGDAVGMQAFDAVERTDLFVPCRLGRGMGGAMSTLLRSARGGSGGDGVLGCAQLLAGRHGLVFLVSDFHWSLPPLAAALDLLASAHVVPVVVWDPAEIEPPPADGPALLRDAESGRMRMIWMRPALRSRWRRAVAQRRAELQRFFEGRALRPFHISGVFDGEALSRHFIEEGG